MPIIQCDIREGRTAEQKAALATAITNAVEEAINAPRESIFMFLLEKRQAGILFTAARSLELPQATAK